MTSALTCLSLLIFFEARGEPLVGQIAVAQVTMNRVASPRYPDRVCQVVTQRHQYEFYFDGKAETIPDNKIEQKAWQESQNVASAILSKDSHIHDYSRGAMHFATNETKRDWMIGAESFTIGNHTMYIGVK